MAYSTDPHPERGHSPATAATGKTTLLEHLLFQGGAIGKPETIESGQGL